MRYDKDNYLSVVCDGLPTKKLKKRIRAELTEHIEDGAYDYIAQHIDEEEAVRRTLDDMGNPHKLHVQLKKAHKKLVRYVRIRNTLIVAFCLFFVFIGIPLLWDEVKSLCYSRTAAEYEEYIVERYNCGYPLDFRGKIEREGRIYRLYTSELPEGADDYRYRAYYIESVRIFGKFDFHDRFGEMGSGESNTNILLPFFQKERRGDGQSTVYFVFRRPEKVRYFSVTFETSYYQSELHREPYESELYAVPETGGILVIDSPEGYDWSKYTAYDEDKTEIADWEDKNDFWGGSSGG